MPGTLPTSSAAPGSAKKPSLWLITTTLSLLLGQAFASGPPGLRTRIWTIVLSAGGVLLIAYWRKCAVLVLLGLIAFGVGFVRHSRALTPNFPSHHLRWIVDGKTEIYLEGVLAREPERLQRRTRWLVNTERIWHATGAEEITGAILITVRNIQGDWRYGDRLRLRVRPAPPGRSANPAGFDYASYLARREIYLIGYLENDASVELVGRSPPHPWNTIENLRRAMRRFFERQFAPDASGLLKALVLGDRGGVAKEMRDDFGAAGVTHLLSISGLHVGMLGAVVFMLVRFCGSFSTFLLLRFNLVKIATCASLAAVFLYTAIAGAMIPSVRAAVMISVYGIAVLLDREDEIWTSLCVAALLITLYWPGAVMEASFQLSFLAVVLIVWGLHKLHVWWPSGKPEDLPQERSRWLGRARQAAFYLAVPLLATVGTGPMIAYHFGYLSLAGFSANPVIVPLVGFVIVPLGLLIGFSSLIVPELSASLAWITEILCAWVYGGVRLFARLPMAKVSVPTPDIGELLLLYAAIVALLLARRRMHVLIICSALGITAVVAGAYWRLERWHRDELRITYLSVGHGDAAVVEFPGSKVLVIDAGGRANGEFDTGEAIVAPFLRSRKILKVDYLLVSHPRVDHYGGMRTIVKDFAPEEFWSGPVKGRTARYEELEESLAAARVKRVSLDDWGSCRVIDRVQACVLHAPANGRDSSVVIRLNFGRVSFLFPGDIERKEELALLAMPGWFPSSVIKVPRHGSLSSNTVEFVAAVGPNLAIFSVGQHNPFGLPREQVVSRYRNVGAEILRTDEDGAVIIETDGQRLRYRTHGSGRKGELVF